MQYKKSKIVIYVEKEGIVNNETETMKKQVFHDIAVEKSNSVRYDAADTIGLSA